MLWDRVVFFFFFFNLKSEQLCLSQSGKIKKKDQSYSCPGHFVLHKKFKCRPLVSSHYVFTIELLSPLYTTIGLLNYCTFECLHTSYTMYCRNFHISSRLQPTVRSPRQQRFRLFTFITAKSDWSHDDEEQAFPGWWVRIWGRTIFFLFLQHLKWPPCEGMHRFCRRWTPGPANSANSSSLVLPPQHKLSSPLTLLVQVPPPPKPCTDDPRCFQARQQECVLSSLRFHLLRGCVIDRRKLLRRLFHGRGAHRRLTIFGFSFCL